MALTPSTCGYVDLSDVCSAVVSYGFGAVSLAGGAVTSKLAKATTASPVPFMGFVMGRPAIFLVNAAISGCASTASA